MGRTSSCLGADHSIGPLLVFLFFLEIPTFL
jgi:hypothetical protein